MSPHLQQLLDQARQLSSQEWFELVQQLSREDMALSAQADRVVQMEQAALATGQVVKVQGGLVVKGEPGELLDLDLVEFVKQGREERMQEVLGW